MPYTRQGARERVCDEIERVVWPIDRAFIAKHPHRRHWIRPTEAIELSQREVADGTAWPAPPSGSRYYTVVKACGSLGFRMRIPFAAPDIGEDWQALTEVQCRTWYEQLRLPEYAELEDRVEEVCRPYERAAK